jgi:dipeptidyl aminopeptidase/acylaminoacyl peptidase
VRKPIRLGLVVALASVCSDGVNAQTKHTPSLEESLSLKTIGGARISPDGRFIAYRVRETDWKENAYVRQIWLANVATGASFQLTRGKKSSDAPEWSPDGRWLAFIGEREGNAIVPAGAAEKKEGKDEKKEGEGKPASRRQILEHFTGRKMGSRLRLRRRRRKARARKSGRRSTASLKCSRRIFGRINCG